MKVKQKNGISLIVLVITIIVMIILATTIILALNGSGVIGKANEAKSKTNEATLLESATLLSAEWDLESKLGNITEDAVTYITNGLRDKGFTDEQIAKLEISETGVIKSKFPFEVTNLKEGEFVTYIDNDGNEIPCVVLYDLETSSKLEIISVDVVGEDIKLEGNANYINILNTNANKYLNNKLASSARSIAYDYKNNDTDITKLNELNIYSLCSRDFWLAGGSGPLDKGSTTMGTANCYYFDLENVETRLVDLYLWDSLGNYRLI